MEKMNDNYNDRIVMHKGEVNFYKSDGSIIQNSKEYFENRKNSNITYFDKLKVGDIVKLKGVIEEIVIVEYVDYKMNDIIKSDYAGRRYNSENSNLVLFGQDDISQVYTNIDQKKM